MSTDPNKLLFRQLGSILTSNTIKMDQIDIICYFKLLIFYKVDDMKKETGHLGAALCLCVVISAG